jgi:hypothetical protein
MLAMRKRKQRKIPRNAVEPLMQTCEWLSTDWGKPATDIFKSFLELMTKYEGYFFSQPWPKKYDHKEATSFTDEDVDFILESEDDFADRYTTMCLKKNMCLDVGFMGYFGMFWTQKAFDEEFFGPLYKEVLEAFNNLLPEGGNARNVLDKLKKRFGINCIHDSLIDLLEHEYPDKVTRKLIEDMFELLHTVEGLASCGHSRCSWYWRKKYSSQTNHKE